MKAIEGPLFGHTYPGLDPPELLHPRALRNLRIREFPCPELPPTRFRGMAALSDCASQRVCSGLRRPG